MFRLLRNVFAELVHIANTPLILTSNGGRFSQPVHLHWCCNRRQRLRLIFQIITQQSDARNNTYYELEKTNKLKFTAQQYHGRTM
jgi:hypothetical protein